MSADGRSGPGRRQLILVSCLIAATLATVLAAALRFASSELRSGEILLALAIGQPASFIGLWFAGLRFARLAGPPATTGAATGATAISWLFAIVSPGRIFELVRPVALNIHTGLPLARGLVATVIERMFDLVFLVGLTLAALAGAAAELADQMRWSAVVLAAPTIVGIGAVAAIIRWPSASQRVVDVLPWPWLRRSADEAIAVVVRSGDRRLLALTMAYSAVIWAAAYFTCYLLIDVAGTIPLSPMQVLFVLVAGTLGAAIAVTPAGLGTYEGAIVLALGGFGYPTADALALAIVLRIANILPAVPAAAWFFATSRLRISEIVARLRSGRSKH
jgi:hypothetical protein